MYSNKPKYKSIRNLRRICSPRIGYLAFHMHQTILYYYNIYGNHIDLSLVISFQLQLFHRSDVENNCSHQSLVHVYQNIIFLAPAKIPNVIHVLYQLIFGLFENLLAVQENE